MNSSETSAKYSWPRRLQKEDIQESGAPEEDDMAEVEVRVTERTEVDGSGEATCRVLKRAGRNRSPLADTVKVGPAKSKRAQSWL